MTPELIQSFQFASDTNLWNAIRPEIGLGLLALFLLVLEIILPKRNYRVIPLVSIAGQLGVLIALIMTSGQLIGTTDTFSGLLRHGGVGQVMRVFFVLTSILVSLLGLVSLAKQKMPRVEFFAIVNVITGAMMLLAQSNHFVMTFVALETVTVGFYVLVSYFRTNPLSLEAGLKYLIMGALSSGILLFGIVLLYGAAGRPDAVARAADPMNFDLLYQFLLNNPNDFLASIGIAFVLAGVAFKIGAVPFQIWVPDVYQGAPTPVTAFLSVGSKAAGFAVLLTLACSVFAPYRHVVIPMLSAMAIATIIFGNLAALTQHNVKRLIGLSGVSHAGYLLIGVIAVACKVESAVTAILFYLFVYLFASFTVFGVMTHLAGENDADQELDHYQDLAKNNPFLAALLAVGIGSLAGIPPLAGFIGKLLIFLAAYQAGLYLLLGVAICGVVVSIYYYFGWIKAAWFPQWRAPTPELIEPKPPTATPVTPLIGATLIVLALISVVLGLYQAPLTSWLAVMLR